MMVFNYMCVVVVGYVHVCLGASRDHNHPVFLKLELTDVCDLPDMDARTRAQLPYKNSSCS